MELASVAKIIKSSAVLSSETLSLIDTVLVALLGEWLGLSFRDGHARKHSCCGLSRRQPSFVRSHHVNGVIYLTSLVDRVLERRDLGSNFFNHFCVRRH